MEPIVYNVLIYLGQRVLGVKGYDNVYTLFWDSNHQLNHLVEMIP